MKAAVVWEPGGKFELAELTRREPGPGDVVVRLKAAGICQTDLSLSAGGFGQQFPAVLGHEGAGEIVEVGSAVSSIQPGDRVLLTWVPPCGRCYHCVRGETYICSKRKRAADIDIAAADLQYGNLPVQAGMATATYAEETVVSATAVLPIPKDLPYHLAALLGCAVPTGVGAALNAARVTPGESVVVIGCGAVGLSAVQGGRISGATTIVAVDPQESRRNLASRLGATVVLSPEEFDAYPPPSATGFDVGIDAVGQSRTIRSTWNAVRRGGRVVVVGAGRADDIVEFSAVELFHDEKTLRGTFYGSSNMAFELPRLIELWRGGQLRLEEMIDDVVPLERINEAADKQISGGALRVMIAQ
ncbi:S-(hydroxymethyl)glutathione dehydrogenase / alcohol dehydrogenase [Brevibacterium sandarakinum]|uniref:S-(Hydroxymethyl)glutathione dehydrogenase / alcohol dehydrogenase n=1 Tax=Brevibacterium sandarakinum TaxID=629680 RepID=A0A1H1SKS2_BRESA|nr:alcohol dehydrogenase catalytic domain-containing protein [Brevibacterium sandarakinum]SDS48585.1 S-(hydroxymethyl)glutathione dehydrogenase / alcohol dehydrogenase [Brevibacterium sandarakinum]